MKAIYVVPNWSKHNLKYTTVSLYIPKSIPLEAMYIKSLLKPEIVLEIIDANADDLSDDDLLKRIKDSAADVMIFNTTVNYILWRCPPVDFEVPKHLMQICAGVNMKTIAIGPHAAADVSEVLESLKCDYVINGEPEIALSKFLNSNMQDMKIEGLCTKEFQNGCTQEINMTDLPIPDFDAVDMTKYEIYSWSLDTIRSLEENGRKGTILEFSRGCIFHCPYCFRKKFRNTFRLKSLEQIEKEIVAVKEKGISYIYFIDEIFNVDKDIWRELLAILKREGVTYGCQARPDIMTYEMIDLMKESGCVYIEYGVESFAPEVLKAINKSVDKQRLIRILAYSYQQFGKENVELGMINFFAEDIMKVLNLNGDGKWNSKVLRPYPDTFIGDKIYELYNITEKKWEFLVRYIWWLQIENYENYYNIQHDLELKNQLLFGDYEECKIRSYEMISKYRNMSAL